MCILTNQREGRSVGRVGRHLRAVALYYQEQRLFGILTLRDFICGCGAQFDGLGSEEAWRFHMVNYHDASQDATASLLGQALADMEQRTWK